MKRLERTPKNVIAFILLAIDVIAFLYFGYEVARNHSFYAIATVINTENMHLTLKEDMSFEDGNEMITIPKGTVIKPENIISRYRFSFYYSTTGLSSEKYKKMDLSEQKERRKNGEIYYFGGKPEYFEECEELKSLWNEEAQKTHIKKTKRLVTIFIPILLIGLVWFTGWYFLTRFLCLKQQYSVLFAADILMLPVMFYVTSLFLFH